MKKLLSLILVLCLIFCFSGCNNEKNEINDNNDTSSESHIVVEKTDKEKYEEAIKYIEKLDYVNAIASLESIGEYNDAKDLLTKCAYSVAIELFNDKKFEDAAKYFKMAGNYKNSNEYYEDSIMYQGYTYVNSGECVKGMKLLEKLLDNERLGSQVLSDLIKITSNLFGGCWKGTITFNGEKLYAELYYSASSNKFQPVIRRYDEKGPILVQDTYACILTHIELLFGNDLKNLEKAKISFINDNLVTLSEHKIISGTFKRSGNKYIFSIDFSAPTLPAEDFILDNSSTTSKDQESNSNNSVSSTAENSKPNSSLTSNVQSNEQNSTSLTASQNSKPNNTSSIVSQNSKPNNISSITLQSSTPSNTLSTTSQDGNPNNTSSEQHTHNFTINATCEQPAKCECGETSGLATGHNWEYATCEAPNTCKNCGKTEGSAIEHDWDDATCDTPKTCITCGKTEGEAVGHKYNKNGVFCCNCSKLNTENMLKNISFESSGNITISITKCSKASKYIYGDSYSFDLEVTITCKEYFNKLVPFVEVYDVNGKLQDEHYILYNAPSNLDNGDNHTFTVTIYVLEDIDIGKIVVGADNKN